MQREKKKLLPWAIALGAVLLFQLFLYNPFQPSSFGLIEIPPYFLTIILYAGINVILAASLNLVNGFTGQFSMGHAGFMSVGGYTAAFITTTLKTTHPALFEQPLLMQFVFLGALLCGGLVASAVGYCVGLPSLRLRGDYLAIVTLGFGEIIRVVLLNTPAVGGARGMPNIPAFTCFGWVYSLVIVTLFSLWRLVYSSYGRSFLSVREDEIAAEAMGVHTTRAKVRAFVIGAFFAGIAGGLFAHYLQYLTPAAFDFNRSFEIIIMVVLGGMGSLSGSAVAAILLSVLREALRPLQEITKVDMRMVIYSLLLIILMLTRPNGLFGRLELPDLLKPLMERLTQRVAKVSDKLRRRS
jgi:branched-chain amino acid transport system permease protein